MKHVYFISFSARMHTCCGIDKWFSNCDLRAPGGPVFPWWSCGQLQIFLNISLNVCFKFNLVYLLNLNQNIRIKIFKKYNLSNDY